jgi:hydrogenase expression/formation protein HypE
MRPGIISKNGEQQRMPLDHERIVLAHGGGGQLTADLIAQAILPALDNPVLRNLGDSAVLEFSGPRLAFTTDSYVVQPLEFPGGDIGRLAVCGTTNDLAMAGAEPLALSLALILEEGLEIATLRRILASIAAAAAEAKVRVVTGDTKVVERGRGDGLYITTAGVGRVLLDTQLGYDRIAVGDVILINGPIAEHGLTVLSRRKDLAFGSGLTSDAAPLASLANLLICELKSQVKLLRDPTRGGVAGVVSEMAAGSGKSIELYEDQIPLRADARAAAEVLGLDPLTIANEGKVMAVVTPEAADKALDLMRSHALGKQAAIIGRMTDEVPPLAELVTQIGGRRVIQMPYGEQLPRIC